MQGLRHGMFERAGVRIHHVTAGTAPGQGGDGRTIVLLHGWPQTWWEWRHIIEPLRTDGWFVVAPDYRGAGASSKPESGYDKQTMAGDVRALLDHLDVKSSITLVSHDLGMLVAYAFAGLHPGDVERLVLMEAPIPGTRAYERVLATTRFSEAGLWHFHFHGAPDNIAETLIAGSEFAYLRSFYVKLSANPNAISMSDVERYLADYTAPGAMRAGLELFRAFEKDADDNRRMLAEKGRLKMPVLGLGGTASFFLPVAEEMLSEVAEDVTVRPIENAGHWVAEEQPETLLRRLRESSGRPAGRDPSNHRNACPTSCQVFLRGLVMMFRRMSAAGNSRRAAGGSSGPAVGFSRPAVGLGRPAVGLSTPAGISRSAAGSFRRPACGSRNGARR